MNTDTRQIRKLPSLLNKYLSRDRTDLRTTSIIRITGINKCNKIYTKRKTTEHVYIQYNYSLEDPPLELLGFDNGASSVSGALRWEAGLPGDFRTIFRDLLDIGRPGPDRDGILRLELRVSLICCRPK